MRRIREYLGIADHRLTLLEKMWLLGPLVLWFSYWPVITLGQDSTSYYELSLAMIYVFGLAIIGLPNIWRARKELVKKSSVQLPGYFVVLSGLSVIFSANPFRGFLTFCVIGALYFVLLAGIAESQRLKHISKSLATLLVGGAVAVSIVALAQVIAGIWLSGDSVLLCQGCAAEQFGFARPNAFAIEPQFLGSLLLAPLLLLLHKLIQGDSDKLTIISFSIITGGLFLTLSRGAIFAFTCGAIVLFILNYNKTKELLRTVALLIMAYAVALMVQGGAAALNQRVEVTFFGAISASINQLSLGIIDIPTEEPVIPNSLDEQPVFDGYVEESTDIRLNRVQLAFGTWLRNPFSTWFGVGLGGSGVAMHERYPRDIDQREIVQNEYVEILLEYGLIGLTVFVLVLSGLFYVTRHAAYAWAVFVAYLVQWAFFSGYPNALHIYLVLIVLFALSGGIDSRSHLRRTTKSF